MATRRLRAGGWVVASEALAHELHLGVGRRFLLAAPIPTALRVAALSTNLGWAPGAIVMNASDYARAWGSNDVSALLARPAAGVSIAQAKRELRAALGSRAGLVVQTASERERAQRQASRSGLARLSEIATLVLFSAAIAMAAAMAAMIWQRRRFLAELKVEGYSTAELWRSLVLEAVVLIGAGCVFGAAFGLLGQRLLSGALGHVTGFPVIYSVAVLTALWTSLIPTLVTAAIVAVLGQLAARISPATA